MMHSPKLSLFSLHILLIGSHLTDSERTFRLAQPPLFLWADLNILPFCPALSMREVRGLASLLCSIEFAPTYCYICSLSVSVIDISVYGTHW